MAILATRPWDPGEAAEEQVMMHFASRTTVVMHFASSDQEARRWARNAMIITLIGALRLRDGP